MFLVLVGSSGFSVFVVVFGFLLSLRFLVCFGFCWSWVLLVPFGLFRFLLFFSGLMSGHVISISSDTGIIFLFEGVRVS